jgi:hypothetical protein
MQPDCTLLYKPVVAHTELQASDAWQAQHDSTVQFAINWTVTQYSHLTADTNRLVLRESELRLVVDLDGLKQISNCQNILPVTSSTQFMTREKMRKPMRPNGSVT